MEINCIFFSRQFKQSVMVQLQVYLTSRFILNGVSVMWTGWLDLRRLDGTARLQLDSDNVDLPS